MATRIFIYNNAGTQQLWGASAFAYDGWYWMSRDSNGRPVIGWSDSRTTPPSSYSIRLYQDDTTIEGLAGSANQTVPGSTTDFSTRDAFLFARTYGSVTGDEPDQIKYVVGEVVPISYRPLSYTDAKIQVDSIVRDEDGVRLKTNYAKKTEIPHITASTALPSGGSDGDIWIQY